MMRFASRLTKSRFAADRGGSVVILFGFAAIIAVGVAGGAVDFGRWMQARHHTGKAMDAAVLAGARALQLKQSNPSAALVLAKQVYDSNISNRIRLTSDTISFVTADNNMAVTATGDAVLKTTLLGVLGITDLPVVTASKAKFPKAKITSGGGGSSNIEIALMLDVTGSMCDNGEGPCTSGTKLQGLKDAAKDLVNIVVQIDQGTYTSKVALVPFSTRVRVGPDGGGGAAMQAVTNLPSTWTGWYNECTASTGGGGSEGDGNWVCTNYQAQHKTNWKVMPCVTDRMYGWGGAYDYTDVSPGSGHWMNAHDGTRRMLAWDGASLALTTGLGSQPADPADFWNYNSVGECSDVAEANEIRPLSSDKTALAAHIDGLEAYGSTSGALGTAFAWYMMSPNWNNVWPSGSQSGNYSDLTNIQSNGRPRLRKVAVLMTDGGYNTVRGWKGQDQQGVSNHAKQLCTNMKAAGIEIYTVGFALNELPPAERAIALDTLQSCGSDLSHFYETINVQQLKDAFMEIAMSLTTVYLSE
jgi:Flp pilus assembly protein TadG